MKYVPLLLSLSFMFALALGCATPSERAQKLFESGQYEQVIARYPNEPVAQQARRKLAEQLLQAGDFQKILVEFSDTPAAALAGEKIAASWIEEEKYQQVLDSFPNTPSALIAREAVAQQLFDDGKVDILIDKYPNSKVGKEAREVLTRQAFESALAIADKNSKIAALEAILTNPLYAGTANYAQAQHELARLKGSKK